MPIEYNQQCLVSADCLILLVSQPVEMQILWLAEMIFCWVAVFFRVTCMQAGVGNVTTVCQHTCQQAYDDCIEVRKYVVVL